MFEQKSEGAGEVSEPYHYLWEEPSWQTEQQVQRTWGRSRKQHGVQRGWMMWARGRVVRAVTGEVMGERLDRPQRTLQMTVGTSTFPTKASGGCFAEE